MSSRVNYLFDGREKIRRRVSRAGEAVCLRRLNLAAVFFWIVVAALLVIYMIEVTAASSRGYVMKDLTARIENLKKETKRLEVEVAGKESVASIRIRALELGMMPTNEVSYVQIGGGAVVRK